MLKSTPRSSARLNHKNGNSSSKQRGTQQSSSKKGESPSKRDKFFMCLKCDDGISNEEQSIQCHDCRQWVHKTCTSLSDRDFQYLSTAQKGIEWICEKCINGENEKQSDMDAKMNRLIDLLEQMEERLGRLEEECSGKTLDDKIEKMVESKVTEIWEEKVEREKRELNLIVTNIPESGKEVREERMEEDMTRIKEVVQKICPDQKDTIKETMRIGKFTVGSKPRLIKVTMKTMEAKKGILRNCRKINQGITDQKEKVYINNDLTPAQRTKNKELREELKARIDNGEQNIGIRGEKIVQVQWKPRLNQGERI